MVSFEFCAKGQLPGKVRGEGWQYRGSWPLLHGAMYIICIWIRVGHMGYVWALTCPLADFVLHLALPWDSVLNAHSVGNMDPFHHSYWPWYNCKGWQDVKHQITCLPIVIIQLTCSVLKKVLAAVVRFTKAFRGSGNASWRSSSPGVRLASRWRSPGSRPTFRPRTESLDSCWPITPASRMWVEAGRWRWHFQQIHDGRTFPHAVFILNC